MTSPVLLALICALLGAVSGTIQRSVMRKNSDIYSILIFNNFFACLILYLFFGLPDLNDFSSTALAILFLSGFFWAVTAWSNLKSSQCLDLNISEVIGKLKYIILTLCGVMFFGEIPTAIDLCGIGLIIIAIFSGSSLHLGVIKRGSCYKLLAVAANSAAISSEKILSSLVDVSDIAFASFFISGMFFFLLRPGKIVLIPKEIARSQGRLLMIPFAKVFASLALIAALKMDSLSAVIAICQVDIFIIFFFGIFFLKEYSNLIRKGVASILCVAGGMIVSLL